VRPADHGADARTDPGAHPGTAGGDAVLVLAPVIRGQKGEYKDSVRGHGCAAASSAPSVDGQVVRLTDDLKLKRTSSTTSEIVIDRLK